MRLDTQLTDAQPSASSSRHPRMRHCRMRAKILSRTGTSMRSEIA